MANHCEMAKYCVSVVQVPHGSRWTYYQPTIYVTVPRSDDVLTWRFVRRGDTKPRRCPKLAAADALVVAASNNIPFIAEIRHGSPVKDEHLNPA